MAKLSPPLHYFTMPLWLKLHTLAELSACANVHSRRIYLMAFLSSFLVEVCRLAAIAAFLSLFIQLWGATAQAADITIPRAAALHKSALIRAAHAELGLDAPVALLSAQIHTESRWRADAVSPVGAQGLAQFMPATSQWLPTVAPHTGDPLPFNPGWSIRAMCAYDRWLWTRITKTASACDRWAFTLCAYNGGLGWVIRDRALAPARGHDPARYWDQVELVNAGRRASAFRENRDYARRIFEVQHVYERAGWGLSVPIIPHKQAARGGLEDGTGVRGAPFGEDDAKPVPSPRTPEAA